MLWTTASIFSRTSGVSRGTTSRAFMFSTICSRGRVSVPSYKDIGSVKRMNTQVRVTYLAFFSGSSNHRRHVRVRRAPSDTKLGHRNTKLGSNGFEPVHFSKRVVNQGSVGQVLETETEHSFEDYFRNNIHQIGKMDQLLQTFRLNQRGRMPYYGISVANFLGMILRRWH